MRFRLLFLVLALAATDTRAQGYGPPSPTPWLAPQRAPEPRSASTDLDRRRLTAAADRLASQRPGVVDAYVVVVALDSDPVFASEARKTAQVLAQRYDAVGRTLVLAGIEVHDFDPLPRGSPETLATALARVGAAMDPAEDVLILYITAHGTPAGIAYRDRGEMLATLSPEWLDTALKHAGVRNRMVMISACFSGLFVPRLSTPAGVVITAAASDRTSFGCQSDNDWTFFGDALINHAFRKGQPLGAAFGEARAMIGKWEAQSHLIPSQPQIAIGAQAAAWLKPLELRMPKLAGAPVGRPATDVIDRAVAANH